jgi:hypothetical protein
LGAAFFLAAFFGAAFLAAFLGAAFFTAFLGAAFFAAFLGAAFFAAFFAFAIIWNLWLVKNKKKLVSKYTQVSKHTIDY